MKKVILYGDSIRLSYMNGVKEQLGSDFEVYAPTENCRFAKFLLRQVFEDREILKDTDIVHLNSGLWDICNLFGDGTFTSEQEYIDSMLRITDILLSKCKKVIFATTTPVNPKNFYNSNKDIIRFNEIIVPLLKEKGVIINDLYTPVAADIEKFIADDTLHLSDSGVKLCTELVVNKIKEAANEL